MQRKIAIIDLGSNTTRLVILAYTPGVSFHLIDQVRERVRLSEGMGAEIDGPLAARLAKVLDFNPPGIAR